MFSSSGDRTVVFIFYCFFLISEVTISKVTADDILLPSEFVEIDSVNNAGFELIDHGNGAFVPVEGSNNGFVPVRNPDRERVEIVEMGNDGSVPMNHDVIDSFITVDHAFEIPEIGNSGPVPIGQDGLEITNIGDSGSIPISPDGHVLETAEINGGGSIPDDENHGSEMTEIYDGGSVPISQDGLEITNIGNSGSIPINQDNHELEISQVDGSIITDQMNHGPEITEMGSDAPPFPISQDNQGLEIVNSDSIPTNQDIQGFEITEIDSDGSISQNHGDIGSDGSFSIDHADGGLDAIETDADGEASMTPAPGNFAQDTPDVHLNLRNLQTVHDLLAMRKDNSFVIEASENEIMHLIAMGMVRETQVVPLTTLLEVYDATKEDRTFHPGKPYVPTTWPEELDNEDAEDPASAKPEDVNSDINFEGVTGIPVENVVFHNNRFENFIGRSENASDSDARRSSELNKLSRVQKFSPNERYRSPNPYSNLNDVTTERTSIPSTSGPTKYVFPETTSANSEFPPLKTVSESEDNLQNFESKEEKSTAAPTPPPNAGHEVPSENIAEISVETKSPVDEGRRADIESNDIDIDDSTLNPLEIKPNLNETISNSLKPSTISQSTKDPILNQLSDSNKTIPNSLEPSTKSKTDAAHVTLNFIQQNFFFVAENETEENAHSFPHKGGVKRHGQRGVSTRLHGGSEKSFSYPNRVSEKPPLEPSSIEGIQRKDACDSTCESQMYEKAWQHFLLNLFRNTTKNLTPAHPEFKSRHSKADDLVATCNRVKGHQINTPKDFVKLTSSHPTKSKHNDFKSISRHEKHGCNKVGLARQKLNSKALHPLLTSKKFDTKSKSNTRYNEKFLSNLYEKLFRRYKNKRPKKHHHREDYVHEGTLHYKVPISKGH